MCTGRFPTLKVTRPDLMCKELARLPWVTLAHSDMTRPKRRARPGAQLAYVEAACVCMYAYLCTCVYVCVRVCVRVGVRASRVHSVCVRERVYVRVYVCTCI